MMATSLREESAYASIVDSKYNLYLTDNFSREFSDWLTTAYQAKPDFKIGDLTKEFPKSVINSHMFFKSTGERSVDEVLLREFFPVEDQLLQTGIDSKQEGVKFFRWDDLLSA